MKSEDIVNLILAAMPTAQVKAQDLTGGGDHWRLEVVADEFANISMVEQHQMVYRALGDLMSGPIHALSLDTRAP